MMENILTIQDIEKRFGQEKILKNISLEIYEAEIVGLIGKNGSGKTTLFNIILDYLKASAGSYLWGNQLKPSELSNMISRPKFFDYLSAYENLYYFSRIRAIDPNRISEVLELVKLDGDENKQFRAFSLGMKQRLGIALCLLNQPKVLVLDEPFNGIDPEGIYDLSNLLLELNQRKNLSIFISSHVLEDLYNMCSRFIFIDEGRVIKDISKADLDHALTRKIFIRFDKVDQSLRNAFLDKFGKQRIDFNGNVIIIHSNDINEYEIHMWLNKNDINYKEINKNKQTMNEFFIKTIRGG
ncbi:MULTISPECIES: ABC transporter ATP-binding protein [Aerococcus]|uniref:ABC transporter ATP-binding protein n=1 Tax=Aerococcus TaxID=1375 RepID=UPI000DCCE28E|nr:MULTISPECIES: ABC transporter ATP-binding protein [Aerococcus]KAA9219694.1 ABC transporter ATP-binding protein [Aerococcus loyolae]KAA9263996.1 ABC transporter ATP-binding protein [Aerococcus loyolae]MDK6231209.1 ABC transporter ATP-binding protein [Aerococcus urinae]MDK6257177.1 ABC transporter ATP-binding protein [Aerococcus urinae]MDK6293495.1 ABC transporter ATP-binding protein [Aerococcus urinae]